MSKISVPFVRNPYNYDRDEISNENGLVCPEPSLTVQAEAEDADINTIVRRFGLTGIMPQNVRIPMSGDFSNASDYHSSLNALIAADEAFMAMPAEVRSRFEHDPAKLISFVENPDNYEAALQLGIVNVRAPKSEPSSEPQKAVSSPSEG